MHSTVREDVVLGIGDDAAILSVPAQHQLIQSVDTLVSGVHFPAETSPQDIAYKALAVNLSDMAAMGATPAWFTLALTLPDDDEAWLKAFSESLFLLATKHNVQLVGGDTTHGPLCISITINGFVPEGKALTRHNARVSDKIYVSGTLGDAALALATWKGEFILQEQTVNYLNQRLNRPEARLELSTLLANYASSCIDVSDGLVADLGHIATNSGVAAKIEVESLPLSNEFKLNVSDQDLILPLVLAGGDDYELCFTIPADKQSEFEKQVANKKLKVTCIGEIVAGQGVSCTKNGDAIELFGAGYDHFVD